MNVKNFIVGGIVGGITNFLLGWLFYGFLFKDSFSSNGTENMIFIFLGCMTFGFFISYIFNQWAEISNAIAGLKVGAIIGLFIGLYSNFFMNSTNPNPDFSLIGLDMIIVIVMSAAVGLSVAVVNGKMK